MNKQKSLPFRKSPFVVIDTILIVAENVAVVVIVVIHEQVAGESVVVEVIGEMPHLLFEVIAFVYEFSCVVFLAVVLSDVAVLEMFEFFAAPVDEIKCKANAVPCLHEHC